MTAAGNPAVTGVGRPMMGGRRLSLDWIGAVPFLGYVALFLFLPTVIIVAGAFANAGGPTLSNFANLSRPYIVSAVISSVILSAVTAVGGAVLGALLTYAIATGNPRGTFRRMVTSACGVLAQFGGVILAFAFIAAIGPASAVYVYLSQHHLDYYASGVWLYDLRGLELVYLYFQIPLMVLIFLPAVDGIKPQWREATESLGGGTWHYWRYVAGPLLAPAFLGSTLLLFANALSAYATAAALINQGGPILPLQISNAITSEVGLHEPGFAKAQAVVLIVIVAIVSVLYAVLQRRTARWLQ
ncbi:MAG TPA: ABC transporter permease subunit [Candidatus Dormibacteraeota bacterium]|nr:ABC transporter permease subunit [Candidatus Dormibacteraeota bacterium]